MAKTVEVDLQVNSNIQGSISELKALKRQLKDTAAGSAEFKTLYNQIDDLEDKIKSSKNASSDWIDSLEQAGGPIGALGASLNRAKVATQSFGGALKATGIGLIVSLVAGLAAAFNDNEKAQKKLQPLLTSLQKIFQGVYSVVEPLFFTLVDLATKALPYVSDAFKVVYSSVTAVFQSLGKLGSAVSKLISGDFKGAWNDAKSSVTGFSKNFNDAKNRYEKGSKEMTNTEKENAAKRAEALEKELERKKVAREKADAAEKSRLERLAQERKDYIDKETIKQDELNISLDALKASQEQKEKDAWFNQIQGNNDKNKKIVDSDTLATNASEILSASRIEDAKAEAEAKLAIQNAVLDNVSGGIGILKQLGEKNKALQKAAIIAENAAGIARIIINTKAANAKAIAASPLTVGQPWVTLNTISGALGVAGSLLATKKALSELGGGSASGGSVGTPVGGGASNAAATTTPTTAAAPSFNVVGTSGQNQIAQSLGNQAPIKAFVVSNDVTTAQSLDRNIVNTATIG